MTILISCIGRGSDHVLDDLDLRMFLCAVRAAVVHCEPQYTWNEYSRFEWGRVMQRYGPTERAVTLWGHEIACLFPFGDMKMLTLFANMCCAHWLY